MKLSIHPFVTRALEQNPTEVLDLGAGDGLLSIYAASFGAHVDAIDIKPFPDYLIGHPRISLINEDIHNWISREKTMYDLIIARSIFHYFPDDFLTKLLLYIRGSLKDGGYLYIATMTPDTQAGKFFHDPKWIERMLDLSLAAEETVISEFNGHNHSFFNCLFKK